MNFKEELINNFFSSECFGLKRFALYLIAFAFIAATVSFSVIPQKALAATQAFALNSTGTLNDPVGSATSYTFYVAGNFVDMDFIGTSFDLRAYLCSNDDMTADVTLDGVTTNVDMGPTITTWVTKNMATGLSDSRHSIHIKFRTGAAGVALDGPGAFIITGSNPSIANLTIPKLFEDGKIDGPDLDFSTGGQIRDLSTSFITSSQKVYGYLYNNGAKYSVGVNGNYTDVQTLANDSTYGWVELYSGSSESKQITIIAPQTSTKFQLYRLRTSDTMDSTSPTDRKRVLFFGDSITQAILAGNTYPDSSNGFAYRLSTGLNLNVANAGVPGYVVSQVPSTIADIRSIDLVNILIGTNDVTLSTDLTTFQANYTTMLNNILSANPTAKILCHTIYRAVVPTAYNNAIIAAITQVNSARVSLYDDASELSSGDLLGDEVHLSLQGYDKVLTNWTPVFRELLDLDSDAPVTSDDTGVSWLNDNVTINLTCNDSTGDGCGNTYYTTDGTDPDLDSTSGRSVSFTENGEYTLKYFSVDITGNQESVKTASNHVKIDKTAPNDVGVPSFGVISPDSIEIIKPATVTETGSGLYQWRARRNSTTELPLTSTDSSITDSLLSENTQYSYDAKFKDNATNSSNYGEVASIYTPVEAPTNLTATSTATSITLTTDSFTNDKTASSGYYFSRTGSNSDWIQTNTYTDTGLSCGTSYTYSVKYRNANTVETTTTSISKSTTACPATDSPTPTPSDSATSTSSDLTSSASSIISQTSTTSAVPELTATSSPLKIVLNFSGNTYDLSSGIPSTTNRTPTFSGDSSPNAVIDIFIHSSDPLHFQTTAGIDGHWYFTLSSPLEIGQHEVYITSTDSQNNTVTSETFKFIIEKTGGLTPSLEDQGTPIKHGETWLWVTLGLLLTVVVIYITIKKIGRK